MPPSKKPQQSSLPPATSARPAAKDDARKITLDGTQKAPSAAPKKAASATSKSTDGIPVSSLAGGEKAAPSDKPAAATAPAVPPPKPSDPAKAKVLMTHFAHKRYDVALKEAAQILIENPGDIQALRWQAMCKARQAIAAKDGDAAVLHYEKALEYDEGNHEARDFVRNHHRDKRLNALPFGRYFTNKKK